MSASAGSNVMRSPASCGASSSGSIWSSGRPAATWTLLPTSTSRTRPWTGAVSEVSIFMLSVTATTSPAWTSSPADTGIATTTPGAWAAHQAALVARDAVRHAVDLDEQVGVLHRGQRPVGAPAEAEPALVLGQLLDAGLDRGAVDLDAVAVRAGLPDREAVADAAVEQVERVADVGLRLRAAAAGERVEVGAVGGRLLVAQGDRRLHERGVGVAHGLDVALRLQAVEPAGVDLAGAQLGPAQQLEQEALVGRALVDHHHRVGHRAAQARDRLLARGAVGDDLGQHRVEVGGHGVALGEAGVDADAGAGRQPQQADPAGGGGEAARRVLGVQADLDRVAARRRRIALEPAAGGDVQLERDEVGAGHHLGDRVLDLQARVDLHERELLRLGLVEELDGGGAAVADLAGELGRRLRQLARLLVA